MVTSYHLSGTVCKATKRACPLKGEGETHFDSPEALIDHIAPNAEINQLMKLEHKNGATPQELVLILEQGHFASGGLGTSLKKSPKKIESRLSRRRVSQALDLKDNSEITALMEKRWKEAEGFDEKELVSLLNEALEDNPDAIEDFAAPLDLTWAKGIKEVSLNIEHPDTINAFMRGGCGQLARKVHQATGWPIAVFTDSGYGDTWSGHIVVKTPKGYMDITGVSENPLSFYGFRAVDTWKEVSSEEELNSVLGKPGKPLEQLETAMVSKIAFKLLEREGFLRD